MARDDFIQSDYDINDIFQGKITDDDGHSVNLRVKIPTTWAAVVGEMIGSREWPEYKTIQHFIRDAFYHRMEWAGRQDNRTENPDVGFLAAIERAGSVLQRYTHFQSQYKAFRDSMMEVLHDSATTDPEILRAQLDDLDHIADTFPEPYKTRLLDDIDYWKRRT